MNWKKIFAIVRREYVERVRTKAFWIATLLIPILFARRSSRSRSRSRRKTGGERRIAVVDLTGSTGRSRWPPSSPPSRRSRAKEAEGPQGGPHWSLEPRPVTGQRRRARRTRSAASALQADQRLSRARPEAARERRSRILLVDRLRLHRPGRSSRTRSGTSCDAPEDAGPRAPGGPRERPRAPHEHEGLQGDARRERPRRRAPASSRSIDLPHPHVLDLLHVRLPGHARRRSRRRAAASSRSSSRPCGRPS